MVGVRTNQRGENIFRQYLQWMNEARFRPQWYNALTRNCTSNFVSYLADAKVGGVSRWDWRTLLDGRADEMLYGLGDLAGNLPFLELKRRALINAAAQRAGSSSDFSQQIRKDRTGFQST